MARERGCMAAVGTARALPVVYAAQSLSLAVLELLVHLNSREVLERRYVYLVAEFSSELCRPVSELFALPDDWTVDPSPVSTARLGDRWVEEKLSAVLAVPSVVVTGEVNYLLNPRHPDFRRVRVGKPQPFKFDARLAV
jgi:RES domain-containing protein